MTTHDDDQATYEATCAALATELDRTSDDMVTVTAWRCPYDPSEYAGQPIGSFHCPACGCLVLAAERGHGACLPGLCPAVDDDDHPGQPYRLEIPRYDAEVLGIVEPATDPDQGQQPAAGPELDAEIARVVFGGPSVHPEWYWWDGTGSDAQPIGYVGPPFSTDVAAAMQVFEAMVEMTGSGSIHADMENARGEGLIVAVLFGWEDDAVGANGPLPEAICLAALAAYSDGREGDDG